MSLCAKLMPCLAIAFTLIACKDDKSSTAPAADKKALLTSAKWGLTGHTVTPAMEVNGTMVTDVLAAEGACAKDDVEEYKADGTWVLDNGAQKCSSFDPQTITGKWVLNAAQTEITTTDDDDFDTDYKIVELSAATLKVTTEWYDEGDTKYTETYTFTAKK